MKLLALICSTSSDYLQENIPLRVGLIISWTAAFVGSMVLLFPTALVTRPAEGIDPSWAIGVHLAIQNDFVFGQEIVYTYGPLGYIATRLPIGVTKSQYLISNMLITSLTVWMLVSVLRRIVGYQQLFFFLAAVVILSLYTFDYASNVSIFLFFILTFLLLCNMRRHSTSALAVALVTSVVIFYTKLSVGIPGIILTLIYLATLLVTSSHYRKRFILIISVSYILSIVGASLILRVDLPNYVRNGLHIISGYNDAMYLRPDAVEGGIMRLTLAVLLIAGFAVVAFLNVRESRRDWAAWLAHGLVAMFLFTTFKYAFTRADDSHMRTFFIFAPAVVGSLFLFAKPLERARLGIIVIGALVFSVVALHLPSLQGHFADKYNRLENYARSVWRPIDDEVPLELIASHALPDDIRAAIGEDSVDIVPSEISIIYANDMSYNPRPVIHSYDVYNEQLDQKNASKYLSPDGPAYVIYFLQDIDGRYPFSTESETKLALLSNYEVIRRFGQFLLLHRRAEPRSLAKITETPQAARLSETIALEGGNTQVLKTEINYSLLGRLVALLYQPSPLSVTVIFSNGDEQTYRAVRGVFNGGAIITPFVDQLHMAEMFFDTGAGRSIAGVRFESPAPWAYRNEFTYQITKVDTPPDSVRLAPLPSKATFVPGDPNVILDGWHLLESQAGDTCQWSDGHSARLFFQADLATDDPSAEVTVEIKAGTFYSQTIPLLFNGALLGVLESTSHWESAVYSFTIDFALLADAGNQPLVNEIEFIIPNAASPASLDPSNHDTRVLGLCLWEMHLR
jgi:hypothetical protein